MYGKNTKSFWYKKFGINKKIEYCRRLYQITNVVYSVGDPWVQSNDIKVSFEKYFFSTNVMILSSSGKLKESSETSDSN